jgi:predicted phage terminase large subunit-like protein
MPASRGGRRPVPPWAHTSLAEAWADATEATAPLDTALAAADTARERYPTLRAFAEHVAPKLLWHRHIEVIGDVLEDVLAGRRKRVMLWVPPRHGKTELVSRTFLAYWLLRRPDTWVGLSSYGAELAQQISRVARDRYVRGGGDFRDDSAAVQLWQTKAGGGVWATGVGGAITGFGADLALIDDPLKNAEEANSETIRTKQSEWYQSVLATRLHPGAAVVIVQTRWHEADLSGWLLQEEAEGAAREGWHVVHLPAVADGVPTALPASCTAAPDWRAPGEPLAPAMYGAAELEQRRRVVGPYVWSALYQGRPQALEGGLFRREWWGTYEPAAVAGWTWDHVVQSWDMAFKDADSSDYVAGVTVGIKDGVAYVLDVVRGRFDFPATVRAVQYAAARWPQASPRYVEDKANGSAVLATLRGAVPGLVAVEPHGGKLARAHAVAPVVAEGKVRVPRREAAPWVDALLGELTSFPQGAHDDQVDALTQALRPLLPILRAYKAPPALPANAEHKELGLVLDPYTGRRRPRRPDEAIRERQAGRGLTPPGEGDARDPWWSGWGRG